MNATAKTIHNDWLHTFRALEAYTNGFIETLQDKPGEWFTAGPLFMKSWLKNADWAKANIPRKFQSKVVPGIEYAKAFTHYQTEAFRAMRLNHEPFREVLKTYEPIIKNIKQ